MSAGKSAVALLSGGLDSYTAAAITRRQGTELYALTFQYGQRHAHELVAARRVASALDVRQHLELSVDLAAVGGSSLTTDMAVPKDRSMNEMDIPSTYVPARNTVFLGLALGWAEVVGARELVIGVNALDYSGYPDCRPQYIAAFEQLAQVATRSGVEGEVFRVSAPLIEMTKAEIIQRGVELGLNYALTHSCYDPGPSGRPCLHCDSCLLRARGFEEARMSDPLLK